MHFLVLVSLILDVLALKFGESWGRGGATVLFVIAFCSIVKSWAICSNGGDWQEQC